MIGRHTHVTHINYIWTLSCSCDFRNTGDINLFIYIEGIQYLRLRVCFGVSLTTTRSWQPGQGVAKTAWSSVYSCVMSEHFWLVNEILTSNKKATINLLKLLLGFQSILYLMPSTQHTQACFQKNNCKIGTFLPSAVRDQWPGPRTKWKTRFSNPGTGVTRSWGPSRFSAWPGFGFPDPVMVRVAKTHP